MTDQDWCAFVGVVLAWLAGTQMTNGMTWGSLALTLMCVGSGVLYVLAERKET